MGYFLGLDISNATTNLCFIDEKGTIVHETVVLTAPEEILSAIKNSNLPITKIGIETGAKSNWLVRELSLHYLVECYDSIKMAKFFKSE